MPAVYLSPLTSIFQFFGDTGTVLSGGLIWTYAAGTSTPTATYTDSTGTVSNSNPIILASNGRLNSVEIWQPLGVKIKAIVSLNAGTPSVPVMGTQIGPTLDQLAGINDPSAIQSTFYGGTDTGSANNYVLTFSPGFTSYTNGIIIYWVPANTNTGASVINVNGLGNVSISNPDGSALLGGAIQASQMAVIGFQGGKFVLLSPNVVGNGSFTAQLTGFTGGNQNISMIWTRAGNLINLMAITGVAATSNTTSMTMTGLPSALVPSTVKFVSCPSCGVTDNSVAGGGAVFDCAVGTPLSTSISFFKNGSLTGFTASNNKGILNEFSITYGLQ